MDTLLLSRLQFAVTTVYHFFFVPLTLGLSLLVAIMETLYWRTGRDVYKRMTLFWGKLFLINFAMGVVTGIVQEFQFGMNWSEYSRFVGDIFGAPLAVEALLAFFLESTFLGVWFFGWDKLSRGQHVVAIWLVAIGSNLSALWILIANSFMQQPVGFIVRNGRAEMSDFLALIFNPNVLYQYPHVLAAGLTTAAFFILGISVYHLMRNSQVDLFHRSFRIGAVAGVLGVSLVILNGHGQTQHMVETQPMKIAAAEALWYSENPASFSLFTIGNERDRNDVFAIRIPNVLSLLAYNRLDGEVKGINNLQAEYVNKYGPGDYVPSVILAYWTFRLMVGSGFAMAALAFYALYLITRKEIKLNVWVARAFLVAILLPLLATSTGWLLAELGRQPWLVFGVLKTENGVSRLPEFQVWVSLLGYTVVYGLLMIIDVYLLQKFARAGAPAEAGATLGRDELPSVVAASAR